MRHFLSKVFAQCGTFSKILVSKSFNIFCKLFLPDLLFLQRKSTKNAVFCVKNAGHENFVTQARMRVDLAPPNLGWVDKAGVDPAGHAVLLLARRVGTLPGRRVVVGPVEGHELVALAVRVKHLVALVDGDLVHLNGAARLTRHQDLRRHHLEHAGKLLMGENENVSAIIWISRRRGGSKSWVPTTGPFSDGRQG